MRESVPAILGIIVLFVVSAIVAFFIPDVFSFFDPLLKELGSSLTGKNAFEIILFIFQNNVMSALLGLVLGVFFGLVPIMNALVNGTLVGYVLSRASAVEGLSVIWRLVPHGIFELPAIFISLGLGLRLGRVLFSRQPLEHFKERFSLSIKLFLLVILPLLIIAACIEGLLIAFVN